jgi:shikimate kinase
VSLIFLIGYRGTGKSTTAQALAARLRWDWIDADDELERRHGKSIREIFALEGEPGFRYKETELFAELCRQANCVIATGGGVILAEANRTRLAEAGWTVWLTADTATIWNRLQGDPRTADRRPNLLVGGIEEIENTLLLRRPLYQACADWAISTAHSTADEVAAAIAIEWHAVRGKWRAESGR